MIIGSTKEDLTLEKRVAITPDSAKNIINLGLKVIIEKNYASHLGINDDEFKKHGVQILETSKEILSKNNLLLKVNCPNEDEIKNIQTNSILVGMINNKNDNQKIKNILSKKVTYIRLFKNRITSYLFFKIERYESSFLPTYRLRKNLKFHNCFNLYLILVFK